jgi:hypothetical protein
MKKLFCFLIPILLLAGCSTKPAPVWISAGLKQLEMFKQDFLTGRDQTITEFHFRKAVEELKKGGDADLLGKAWLTRMALQIAVLAAMEEGDYLKIEAGQSVSVNRNYYLFLKGSVAAVDIALLTDSYQPFWKAFRSGDSAKAAVAIASIEDPLSLLIAAGLAVRHNLENDTILRTAVETASRNGWKNALLAWLERLKSFHEAVGDSAAAAAVSRRIDLMK